MIPIQDLRVGNVFWEDYGGYKIVTGISCNNVGLAPNSVLGRAINGAISGQFSCEHIQGVPISEDILIACGFEKDDEEGGSWLSKDNGVPFFFRMKIYFLNNKYRWFINHVSYVEIKYLHQLMNLYYALCGKEINYQPSK